MINLALMLQKGDGIDKDIEVAIHLYTLVAKSGNSDGLVQLGIGIFNGEL